MIVMRKMCFNQEDKSGIMCNFKTFTAAACAGCNTCCVQGHTIKSHFDDSRSQIHLKTKKKNNDFELTNGVYRRKNKLEAI